MLSLALFGDRSPAFAGGAPPPPEAAPELETPIAAVQYVVFDTELTGLKSRKDSIVSIGAVRMAGAKILAGKHFSRVVRPRTDLTGQSVVFHGITPAEAQSCPGIESALPEFLEFCRGGVLVGHAVSLDLRFINNEMRRCYGAPLDRPAVDTLSLSAFLRRREGNFCAFHEEERWPGDLYSLATACGIPVNRAHDAVYDAYVTAQLFQRHLATLPKYGVRTLGELIKVGKP